MARAEQQLATAGGAANADVADKAASAEARREAASLRRAAAGSSATAMWAGSGTASLAASASFRRVLAGASREAAASGAGVNTHSHFLLRGRATVTERQAQVVAEGCGQPRKGRPGFRTGTSRRSLP